jgi:HK97 family phage prohead protease
MRSRPEINRSFPLLDIERGGDGRTVTAYAATFGDPYEVRDQHGHYFESINPQAFNRAIGRGVGSVSVFYNHGRTINGDSPASLSIPIGTPLEIRADGRGLLTVTRYNNSEMADQILAAIDNKSIKAQSFRGPIFQDGPKQLHRSGIPLVERMQLGLIEYGPTPMPVNVGAEMVSVRSTTELLTVDPADLTDDERAELLAALNDLTPPPAPVEDDGTAVGSGDEEAPPPMDPAFDPYLIAQAQRRRRASL